MCVCVTIVVLFSAIYDLLQVNLLFLLTKLDKIRRQERKNKLTVTRGVSLSGVAVHAGSHEAARVQYDNNCIN